MDKIAFPSAVVTDLVRSNAGHNMTRHPSDASASLIVADNLALAVPTRGIKVAANPEARIIVVAAVNFTA